MRPLSEAAGDAAPGAFILAAGLGRRLGGRPKAALHIGGQSLLERLAEALRAAGVLRPRVLLGPYLEQLQPLARRAGLEPVVHASSEPTLVDSQRLAVRAHLAMAPDLPLWLLLGDLTALEAADLLRLREAWQRRAPGVEALVPTVGGQRGHPVLLSAAALQAIDGQEAAQGVRHWLAAHPDRVCFLEVPGPGPVQDLDTEDALQALRQACHPSFVGWP